MSQLRHRRRALVRTAVAAATLIGAGTLGGGTAEAATFVVTNENNSGAGSLRQAIQDANLTPAQDTITFAAGVDFISLTNNITITSDIIIDGPGQGALTITNPTTRVFDVNPGGSLRVESLTINATGSNSIVFGSPTGTMVLDDVTISDSANHALLVEGAASVTVRNSTLSNDQDAALQGDGINAEGVTGDILVEDVDASGNEDNFEFRNIGGNVTLRRITATNAVDEAADFQQITGDVVIENSRFDNNNDQVDINVVTGDVRVSDVTISGTLLDDGLDIEDVDGTALVERTTVSGGGDAGMFFTDFNPPVPTTVTVINSTVSGNDLSGIVAGPGSAVTVRNSTIVRNGRFGITVTGDGTTNVSNSIIHENDLGDISVNNATVSNSLLPANSSYSGNGNIRVASPLLGALANNGGPTRTHLPQAGSPAINAGSASPTPPATDQRGEPRTVGTIDIGSVETSASPPPDRGTISISPPSISVDESVGTVPLTVTRSGGSGSASVDLTTQNGSAAAPGDYTKVTTTVTFGNGEFGSKVVPITIVDDSKVEGVEDFKAVLSNPSAGVTLSSNNESVVRINDNDQPGGPPPLDPEVDAASRFVSLSPQRLFDTRVGTSDPGPKGKVGAQQTIDVQITGVAGVPANATAVVMNVTMTETEQEGFVTVWPTGQSRPLTSNLNAVTPNTTRPNLVTVPIGADGKVSLFAWQPVHLLADVAGYYVDIDEATTAGRLVSLTPSRVFDTRPGEPAPGPKGMVPNEGTIDVQITGQGGVPTIGVAAVVVNLTATSSTAEGFVTAYPSNVPRPFTSVLNVSGPNETAANLAILPVSPDGKISLYAFRSLHLLGDVMGYITDGAAPTTTDGLFVPLQPNRVFDSRPGEAAPGPKGFVGADSDVDVTIVGVGSIPADAASVFLNVTGTQSAGPNFITGWPAGFDRPLASLLNLNLNDTRPNATVLGPGDDGKISLYTLAGAHLLADSFGYFLG